MAFIGSIIAGAISIGGAVMARKDAKDANAQSAANQAEAGRVDYTTMSPEAKKTLQGLFGSAGSLANSVLTQDFNAIRGDTTQAALKAALTTTLAQDVPGLKSAMGKAGAYNSTSYGLAVNDAISTASAKAFYASQAAANENIKSQIELINPLLALLQIDKGSQKVGKEATGIAGVTQANTDYTKLGASASNAVGGILGLFKS